MGNSYHRYRSDGRCGQCGRIPLEGKSLCEYHMEQAIERNTRRMAECREAGICTQCKHRPVMDGYKRCSVCYEAEKDRREPLKKFPGGRISQRKQRIANGLCVYCGNVPPKEGVSSRSGKKFIGCQECIDKRKADEAAVSARREAEGVCKCGRKRLEGYKQCRKCLGFHIYGSGK